MNMNQAWGNLFEELDIRVRLETTGQVNLTAEQIRRYSGKEPRIMSKWDSREARPEVLRRAGVTILPTSRQGYVLLKGDGYLNLPLSEPAIHHSPEKLERFTTLPWREELTRESLAIDVAAISSMLKQFTGERDFALTIRGRSGTPEFSFDFQGTGRVHRITVDRAQIEVDAGFEGDCVWLIEAKIGEPEDFLVRQLFYPWRLWQTLTRKLVVPVFLTYTNKTFGLFRYGFGSAENYHSITLVEKRWFTLDEPEGVASLSNLFAQTRAATPDINIFPQADTLGSVIAAVELYAHEINTVAQLADRWSFDLRQGHYYADAAEWLGLLKRTGSRRQLTAQGMEFVAANRWRRFKILFQAVAATPVFRECIRRRLDSRPANIGEIGEMILVADYGNRTTANRRAQTVLAWLDWLWREHENLQPV